MIRCMIAAPSSGSGKTVFAMALLSLLKQKGRQPSAFKCGPDYIDPMFHRSVQDVSCRNLDLFLCVKERLRELYARHAAGADAVVAEGVMGFYDGLGGVTAEASAHAVSEALSLPVLLVVSPKGSSVTLAAVIRGLKDFRENRITAVFLNSCSESLFQTLAPMLEKETGLPVLGFLPPLPEAEIASRHLGLFTSGEIADLKSRIDAVTGKLERNLDFPRFTELFSDEGKKERNDDPVSEAAGGSERAFAPESGSDLQAAVASDQTKPHPRIAVAQDEAFCFCYEETLEVLRDQGAELVFFSPMRDKDLPENCGGLLLSGGYPELYAKELSENAPMRSAVRNAVSRGLPTIAECGGFLYLQKELRGADGNTYPMAGVFRGTAEKKERLVRFGYTVLSAEQDSLLFRKGEKIPVHEFHYFDTDDNGEDLLAVKPVSGKSYRCGYAGKNMYAGFPHLYLWGSPALAERFVREAADFLEREDALC